MDKLLKGSSLVATKASLHKKKFKNIDLLTHKSASVANSFIRKARKGGAKKIAIVSYSLFGHNINLAEILQASIVAEGGKADIFSVPHTVYTEEELESFGALIPKYPAITLDDLLNYDAFLFGFPSRFGNMNTEWAMFWETTEGLMLKNALFGKPFGTFVSSATPGGGLEVTQMNVLSLFIYHGMVYVPIGSQIIKDEALSENAGNFGGSAWGCGTFTSADNTRVASRTETNIAAAQAKHFYYIVKDKF